MGLLSYTSVVLFLCVSAVAAEETVKEFSIRPSVDDSVKISVGSTECVFSWTDCTGGSSEVWEARLVVEEKKTGKAECVFMRPRMSYLTFMSWKAQLSGPGVADADVMVVDGEGRERLQNTDFIVKKEPRVVLVSNAKQERHTMQGLQIVGKL